MDSPSSPPDYSYKGLGKTYLAIHLTEKLLVIRGNADKQVKADYDKTLPFTDIIGVRNFQASGFWVKTQGIELEIRDLDTPIVRISMNPKEQKVWLPRISQICGMRAVR